MKDILKDYQSGQLTVSDPNVKLSLTICNSELWPGVYLTGQPTPDLHLSSLEAPEYLGQIIFPESMLTATLTNFKKEFKEQNQRTLFFTAHLGHGEIQYQNILFVVSTAQMIILDLFNDSRVLTLNQISIMTQLPKKLLLTSLKGLIQQIPQLRDQKTDKPSSLLNRVAGEGPSNQLNPTDKFSVNEIKSKLKRINLYEK